MLISWALARTLVTEFTGLSIYIYPLGQQPPFFLFIKITKNSHLDLKLQIMGIMIKPTRNSLFGQGDEIKDSQLRSSWWS